VQIESDFSFNKSKINESFSNVIEVLNKKQLNFQELIAFKFKDKSESSIYAMIVHYLLKAETLSPGSAEIFLNELYRSIHKRFEPQTELALNLTSSNIDSMLMSFAKESIQKLIIESIHLAGINGKIVLSTDQISGEKDIIELSLGSFFPNLFSAFNLTHTKILNPKIICIDGFIENVSEIHRLLEDVSNNKENIVLFVKGMSEDVIHTLKINYDRGTLSVIPIIVKHDLDGINLLNDIAVASGGDIVSSLKGQLISCIDVNTFQRIDAIDINSSGVLIENHNAASAIDIHVFNLQKKHIDNENEAVQELITKRIQNLGTTRISIKLVNDKTKKIKSFEIDRCLRAIKSASTHGIAQWESKVYPLASIKAGKFYAEKFYKFISSIGAIIT